MNKISTTANFLYPIAFKHPLNTLQMRLLLPTKAFAVAIFFFAAFFLGTKNAKAEGQNPNLTLGFVVPTDSIGLERHNGRLYIRHKVRAGEDILGIARRYYVDVNTLISLNPFARNPLQQGQIVRIPYQRTEAPTSIKNYTVRADDTLYKIALKFGTSAKAIKDLNQMATNEIRIGQDLLIPMNENTETTRGIAGSTESQKQNQQENKIVYQYYTIEAGDNLIKIANKHKITVSQLKEWNQLTNDTIRIGQKLIVGKSELYTTHNPTKSNNGRHSKKTRTESGVCSMIDSEGTRFLGLHRTLPVGSMVRVFNDNTGLSVEVEIIGKIPNISANENIIIKITKAACYQLGTKAKAFPVVLTWEAK